MSLGYDDVIERLIGIVENHPVMDRLDKIVVVRDLHGRVRLVVRGSEDEAERKRGTDDEKQRKDLDGKLTGELGAWYGGSVLSATQGTERQLAQHVIEIAEPWPEHWPSTFDDGTGGRRDFSDGKWSHVQRVLGKEGWLGSAKSSPPWPLKEKTPTIVAFYSFKGGVGRSTALGITAWRLAKPQPDGSRKRVVVVDLDLEAPGLDGLFGIDRATVERGVLDWLLESAVGQQPTLNDPVNHASRCVHSATIQGAEIAVVPAGKTSGASYLEKLARLDYHGTTGSRSSPVQDALERLLIAIKKELKPDFILLDARAGFHDLGGLSLTSLAHIDVLVARHTASTEPGLSLTLKMLKRRRSKQDQLVIMAQAFASPAHAGEDDPHDRREFRELVGDMLPPGAPLPICLEENGDIARGFKLGSIALAALAGATGYDELLSRIETLARGDRSDEGEG